MKMELGSVFDALPGLVWTALPDGSVDHVNHAWREYTGHHSNSQYVPGWEAIAHPDDLANLLRAWQLGHASCSPFETDARLRRFDGTYHRFVLRMRPLGDGEGKIVKWCGVGTDIDSYTRTDRPTDVRDSDLREIVDSIPAFIGLASPSGEGEYFNRFAREYLGATLDDLTGSKAVDTVHPEDLPAAAEGWKRAVESGEPYDSVHRVRRADGIYRWFQARGLPLRGSDGNIARWFLVDADIEEQKRGEALLSGEKQLLEMVARGQPRTGVLDAFCRLVETTISGCRCSVMLLDPSGARMELSAGPSLPPNFVSIISGCAIGTDIGPCPMAIRLREQVIAPDLATETRWTTTRWPALAMAHGLYSCWSTPVIAASGEVLGVFAIYYNHPKAPTPQDLVLIAQLTHIASIAIERMRSQRSIEQALDDVLASEDRLRSIIDAVPGFVWSTAPDGSVDFLNQRWCEYTGMTMEEASGFGWTSAVHPDDAVALAAYWQALLVSGQPGEYEARLRRHDDVYRWFLIRAVPQRDAAGRVVKWYGANTDIEDRKQAEALLAGEKKLLAMMAGGTSLASILDEVCRLIETIMDGAMCSIVLIDPRRSQPLREEGPLLFLQAGASPNVPPELMGHVLARAADADADPVAWSALAAQPMISPDIAREARWKAWRSVAMSHGIRANWSVPITCVNGMVAGILSILYREVREPEPTHQAFIARFTHLAHIAIECARWETALRQSEAFLAKAQRLSLTGTFSWRVSTDEITWSDEIYRIVEVDPEETPTLDVMYARIHPEDMPSVQDVLKRRRTDGRDFEHEHRLLMPDGRVKHVHLVAHATKDEDGGLEYIAAMQDITQRRQSEEALGKVRSELTHVARVASLGALTASIAHEVNQPLAGIITNANTCLRMLASDPPNVDGARETARRTIRDGNRASEVIQRLRALFTKKDLSAEPVDLNEATREVLAMLLGELQLNSVMLQTEYADGLPMIRGDRVQLQQVIVNLILNAADAMHAITDRPHHLHVSTSLDDQGRACLAVRDNGIGFDTQDTERLFHAFYTTKSTGMGIGLSVSRSILERHGGELWATPNDGPGARFTLAIPVWSETTDVVLEHDSAWADTSVLSGCAKEAR
ncbi:PAS domain-containing protein [Dyella koreensis]|uniref:histidine kinase n=1 Tax=Dyella koreensis TaxID=311235 RepID=A0ABW8K4P7_9GAMM